MVFLDGPYIVGNVELLGDVAQILVVAHDTGNVHIPLACLVACEEVVKTVAHLADEDGHARALVGEIEVERHLIACRVERGQVFLDFILGDEEFLEFPLDAHEEHAVLAVHILVEIDDVSLVVGNELGYFRNDSRLVGTV